MGSLVLVCSVKPCRCWPDVRLLESCLDGEGFLNGPASTESAVDDRPTQSGSLGPFGQTERFSLERDDSVCPFVSALMAWDGPATIFWSVITIIVDAIQGVLGRWFWSHVSKELREVIEPFLTNADASSSIIVPTGMAFIATSFFHACPCPVFGGELNG